MHQNITTIAFDYGGVLAEMISDKVICHMAGVIGVQTETFKKSLWKFRHDFDLGALDGASYWRSVAEDAGSPWPNDSQLGHELLETFMHLDTLGWTVMNPGVLRWIKTLNKEGYRCLMISNMAVDTFDMLSSIRYILGHFEHIIISGKIGINKPARGIFLEASRLMDVQPGEMLFFDDLSHNVEGARKAGLHALQFTSAEQLYRELGEMYPEIPRQGLICR